MNRGIKFLTLQDEVNNDLKTFGDFFGWDLPAFTTRSFKIYSEDDYDLVPKPHVQQKRLKELERELETLKNVYEMQKKSFEGQSEKIKLEIEQIKQKIGKAP